jgi:cell division protein FtsI/penicillin-binding protein 2
VASAVTYVQPESDQAARPPARPTRPRQRPKRARSMGSAVKVLSMVCAAAVVIIAGLVGVGPSGASVTESVKTFLYDWETGDYAGAASMTTGSQPTVKAALRAAFRQLGAEDLVLKMGPISVGRNISRAWFQATIDLGRGGLPWQYWGHLKLRRVGDGWLIVWSPSVIVPGLGTNDRLAVITIMPGRASLLDATGQSLIRPSTVYEVGVWPDGVTHPATTAADLTRVTHLPASDADQMRGVIEASPPDSFLGLVHLSPAAYHREQAQLQKIPGVKVFGVSERLFQSTVPDITGQIGTETSPVIAQVGEPYRPGATVGESGLELAYQEQLAGTATTEVIVQNAAGKLVKVLHRWAGQAGTPVHTTIDGRVQSAAQAALTGLPYSAAIVAIRAGGGQVLAVASQKAAGMPAVDPLVGQYQPAQTFSMVSTAAALASVPGFSVDSGFQCGSTNRVGGQVFSNVPSKVRLGASTPFRVDFAHACNTAFVGLSLRLSASSLVRAAKAFGVGGSSWRLPLAAFDGSIASPGNVRDKAADMIGTGSVRVSPLVMALAAGVAESGEWLPPTLVSGSNPRPTPTVGIPHRVISQIQRLMRATVRSGAARAANRSGVAIYGQVGAVAVAGNHRLWANWFVGFRGNVAFAVIVFTNTATFDQAASIAGQFAAALPASALSHR